MEVRKAEIIHAETGDVFNYLSNVENYSQFATIIKTSHLLKSPFAKGSTYLQALDFLGMDLETTFEVVDVFPNRSIVAETVESAVFVLIEMALEPIAGRTQLTFSVELEDYEDFRLSEETLKVAIEEELTASVLRLKNVLETRAAA